MLGESLPKCDRSYLASNGNAFVQKWLWDFRFLLPREPCLATCPHPWCIASDKTHSGSQVLKHTRLYLLTPCSRELRAHGASGDDVWWPFKICSSGVTTAVTIFYFSLRACKQPVFLGRIWMRSVPSVPLVTTLHNVPDRPRFFFLFWHSRRDCFDFSHVSLEGGTQIGFLNWNHQVLVMPPNSNPSPPTSTPSLSSPPMHALDKTPADQKTHTHIHTHTQKIDESIETYGNALSRETTLIGLKSHAHWEWQSNTHLHMSQILYVQNTNKQKTHTHDQVKGVRKVCSKARTKQKKNFLKTFQHLFCTLTYTHSKGPQWLGSHFGASVKPLSPSAVKWKHRSAVRKCISRAEIKGHPQRAVHAFNGGK